MIVLLLACLVLAAIFYYLCRSRVLKGAPRIVIVGKRGSGKTHLFLKLRRAFLLRDDNINFEKEKPTCSSVSPNVFVDKKCTIIDLPGSTPLENFQSFLTSLTPSSRDYQFLILFDCESSSIEELGSIVFDVSFLIVYDFLRKLETIISEKEIKDGLREALNHLIADKGKIGQKQMISFIQNVNLNDMGTMSNDSIEKYAVNFKNSFIK